MPSKGEILNILASDATKESPLHRNKLAEKLGEKSYRSFQTQLDRFETQGLIEGTPDHEYWITDLGKKTLSDESMVTEELDEEKLGTTDYQKFIQLGKMHGVSPPELIKLTAEHVWNGGDFRDLDWVAKAFEEMGVRSDLRQRWWHSWRVKLGQPIPSRMPSELVETDTKGEGKKDGKRGRSFLIDEDLNVVFVGYDLGDMYYDDAMELAKIRAGRSKGRDREGSPSPGDSLAAKAVDKIITDMQAKSDSPNPLEETSQFISQFKALAELMGVGQKPDSTEEMSKLITLYNSLKDVFEAGKPAVSAAAPTGGWVLDKSTGQIQQWQPGQPPIIIQQPQSQQSQYPYTPIEMKDKDGNPMVLDLSTFIRLEEHKDKQRRDQESHETKQEIAKSFKDLISKATSALGHMAEEK